MPPPRVDGPPPLPLLAYLHCFAGVSLSQAYQETDEQRAQAAANERNTQKREILVAVLSTVFGALLTFLLERLL